MDKPENPSAFPLAGWNEDGPGGYPSEPGMTLRDWFAGQALANPSICTGTASEWELSCWFGKLRTGITRAEIIAKQAREYADAMLAARSMVEG